MQFQFQNKHHRVRITNKVKLLLRNNQIIQHLNQPKEKLSVGIIQILFTQDNLENPKTMMKMILCLKRYSRLRNYLSLHLLKIVAT